MKDIRIYVERKEGFTIERDDLFHTISENFGVELNSLRYILIYDIFGIKDDIYSQVKNEILSEPNKDMVSESIEYLKNTIAYEYLPGQFDQRADSAMQCVKLINPKSQVVIKSSTLITFDEKVTDKQKNDIQSFLINKVESREKDMTVLELETITKPKSVPVLDGFVNMNEEQLNVFHNEYGLAMNLADLQFIQDYFKNEESVYFRFRVCWSSFGSRVCQKISNCRF